MPRRIPSHRTILRFLFDDDATLDEAIALMGISDHPRRRALEAIWVEWEGAARSAS